MRPSIYACFACRKVFRREPRADWSTGKPVLREESATCPGCGGPLHYMGHRFRAPRKRDVAQWRKVEQLFRAGLFLKFHGGRGPDRRTDAQAIERFVESARASSEGERLQRRYASRAQRRK